jgi:hypothetical protein
MLCLESCNPLSNGEFSVGEGSFPPRSIPDFALSSYRMKRQDSHFSSPTMC